MPRSFERPGVCYFYHKMRNGVILYPDCVNQNPLYCGICKHFLCDTCRADYHRRAEGMKTELEKWIGGIFNFNPH